MNSPFRTRGFSTVGSNPHVRRQHRSSSSASYHHPSHTTNASPPPPRQAGLHLDFIIIGGGLLHVLDTVLRTTDMLLRQESLGFQRHMRLLPRAIAFKY
jgi:hypothetical protein